MRFANRLPPEVETLHLNENDAMRAVPWLGAMMYAESVGKRLPWEDEWEFAATNGGHSHYPWGEYWDPRIITSWSFGPIGTPSWDVTQMVPGIHGLYSGVGEWTMSYFHEYPGTKVEVHNEFQKPQQRAKRVGRRIVRGAPTEVLRGHALTKAELANPFLRLDPRERAGWDPYVRLPGLGFRCARSAEPHCLHSVAGSQ
jgi:formylglycine-generating enzyme required for sulfatase activity